MRIPCIVLVAVLLSGCNQSCPDVSHPTVKQQLGICMREADEKDSTYPVQDILYYKGKSVVSCMRINRFEFDAKCPPDKSSGAIDAARPECFHFE